jgi:hypothetical protein
MLDEGVASNWCNQSPKAEYETSGREGNKLENFVLTGKAKTVFRLLELKAQREELARLKKKYRKDKKK